MIQNILIGMGDKAYSIPAILLCVVFAFGFIKLCQAIDRWEDWQCEEIRTYTIAGEACEVDMMDVREAQDAAKARNEAKFFPGALAR